MSATATTTQKPVTQESSISEQIEFVCKANQKSVWDGVKDSAHIGLNVGVSIGVAVVIVSLVGAACSFIPNGNRDAS